MESTVPTSPLTFRVENIPPGTTAEELIKYFCTEDQPRIRVRSIVPAVDSYELNAQEYTATISFRAPDQSVQSPRLLDEDLSIDCDFHGFTPLNQPQEPIAADIIAVTGLAAHAFGSWAHSAQNMWLRDYLPRDVSNARVLLYGYPSQLQGSISRSILSDHSTNMIDRLLTMRETSKCQDRPIVFIGHSLGCLVIKKVLCAINGSLEKYNSRLPVRSIIFLGAPHKGLETTALETLVKSQPSEDLIRELRPESPTLTDLNDRFRYVAKDIDILTCYELKLTKTAIELPDGTWKREGPLVMMVSSDSARQWLPRETFVACNADHSQIAKLKRGEGGIYPNVRSAIKKALHSAGDLYRETKGINCGECRNIKSAAEATATHQTTLQAEHRQLAWPSNLHTADSALTPSRSPSEDTIERQIRRVGLEQSVNPDDNQSKNNPFNGAISQRYSSIAHRESDDIQLFTNPTKIVETDKASALLDEDNCTSKDTVTTISPLVEVIAPEHTTKIENLDPTREEVDQDMDFQTEDIKFSTEGTKNMIIDTKMKYRSLHLAILKHDKACTIYLLMSGADVEAPDKYGWKPLHTAAFHGDFEMMKLLLTWGAKSEAQISQNGWTPLHAAARYGTLETIKVLLDRGVNIEAPTRNGSRPLHTAAGSLGKHENVRVLLDRGANIEATDNYGWTPLHVAASNNQLDATKVLLDRGANPTATTSRLRCLKPSDTVDSSGILSTKTQEIRELLTKAEQSWEFSNKK